MTPRAASPAFGVSDVGDRGIGRSHPLALIGAAGGAAGITALAVRLATPFDHGIWLVAYLLLVGCIAPLLLAAGERRLLAAPIADEGAGTAAALWLCGVLAVPAGVLGDARVLVWAGALALAAALALLARRAYGGAAPPAPGRGRAALLGHGAMIASMAASTAIGVALAWDYPWL